jgi:hypothetical protein
MLWFQGGRDGGRGGGEERREQKGRKKVNYFLNIFYLQTSLGLVIVLRAGILVLFNLNMFNALRRSLSGERDN